MCPITLQHNCSLYSFFPNINYKNLQVSTCYMNYLQKIHKLAYLILSEGLVARRSDSKFQPAPQFLSSICKKNNLVCCSQRWKRVQENAGYGRRELALTWSPVFPDEEFLFIVGNRNSRKQEGSFPYMKWELKTMDERKYGNSLSSNFSS